MASKGQQMWILEVSENENIVRFQSNVGEEIRKFTDEINIGLRGVCIPACKRPAGHLDPCIGSNKTVASKCSSLNLYLKVRKKRKEKEFQKHELLSLCFI